MTKEDMLRLAKANGHTMSKFKRRPVDGVEKDYEVSVCKWCRASIVLSDVPVLKSAATNKCTNWED